MKGYEALPGIDDVKLCKAMFNLAFTNEMRDGEFAETSYRQALEFSLSRLSQTHPLMTTISMGLGRTLLHEGRVGESIKIFENVISTCGQHEELYDMKMGAFLQLAVALSNRGQMMEAEDLLRRCSGEITDKLGPEHMLCIEYDLRLGCILITRGNFTEAEILLAKTLREGHANSLQLPQLQLHLGRIYEKSERYEQSIEILQQALEYGQTTGMFIIQNIVFTLGHSLLHEKRYNEAEKCITKFRNADSQKSSRLENAEKMYAEFLEKAQTVYVENHPEVLDCLLGLGMVSQGQERIEKASSFYSRAMEGSQAWYGPDHAYTRRFPGWLAALAFSAMEVDEKALGAIVLDPPQPQDLEVRRTAVVTNPGGNNTENGDHALGQEIFLDAEEIPTNWSPRKKWPPTLVVVLMTTQIGFCASMHTAAIDDVAVYFNCSNTVSTLGVTTFFIGFATGPLIFAPLSEVLGRNPVYNVTLFAFLVFNLGCALAPNVAAMLMFRFLAAFFGSPTGIWSYYSCELYTIIA
ncbi:MAG: hypothetical protein Q9157_001232 [Trypethelium eluteriae]